MEDARRLSAELGGADEDVKRYFFTLGRTELASLLDEYGRHYGTSAREYAEATFGRWKSGERRMSGTVAERLFSLLPPRMPLADKYRLTETLWKHYGPSSKKVLRVGIEAPTSEVEKAFLGHIDSVLTAFKLPQQLEQRFHWLSSGDVTVKQQLLDHRFQLERALVAEGIRAQLPVMREHLRSDAGGLTKGLKQTVVIGKHQLELIFEPDGSDVVLEDPAPPYVHRASEATNNWGCMIIIGIALLLLLVMANT